MSAARPEPLSQELHAPLSPHEAQVESERCYFCFDAPCVTACPTGIDIPLFIRQIHTGNVSGAARTIFDENIFGGMCARVCPTETLCEQGCVRHTAEDKPVVIGQLQRFATDALMATGQHPYQRSKATGKRIAIAGAGPAGLACAHRLAMQGHEVTVFDANTRAGGLNEYGIAAYKSVDDFAQKEVVWLLSIGGIQVRHGTALGRDTSIVRLKDDYDAVFIATGLAQTHRLGIEGEEAVGVRDAVDFIAELRQSDDHDKLDLGRRVVVIGGGMTAIDAAVQSRLLGAEEVTLVYRRSQALMNASPFEQQVAQTRGVLLRTNLQPRCIETEAGRVSGVTFDYTRIGEQGQLELTGESLTLTCDRVLKAIGQAFESDPVAEALTLQGGRIAIDDERRTSDPKVWAGGDCAAGREDLTVVAVQDGKLAAESMHRTLS